MDPELIKKKREYEARKTRTKLALNICTICGKKDARPCKGCGTTAYCSTDCQRIDWRDRGHRKVCKKIQDERAAEAPTRAPSPPRDVFYGPAPRSHADVIRARITAEHEAARVRREANPEREPLSARFGSRCPICLEEWDVNDGTMSMLRTCCCRRVCKSCSDRIGIQPCPLCRVPCPMTNAEALAQIRRHVENEVPEAITFLGDAYRRGLFGLVESDKKAAKIWKRAAELGDVDAMIFLGAMYAHGSTGVKLDKKKAERLYRMGADRGDAGTQCNLGILLDSEMKFEEALRYYALAADQGLTTGEFCLGCCYVAGSGTEVDLGKARYWFERAAAKGFEDAIVELAELDARV